MALVLSYKDFYVRKLTHRRVKGAFTRPISGADFALSLFIFRMELFFLYIIKHYSNAKSDS